MADETPIQTETEVPTEAKRDTLHVAYMFVQGDNHLQYKAFRLVLNDRDEVMEKTMIGNPDLKAVVFGRLLKLIFAMR